MSTEIIILAVTGITASLLYISKHLVTSECWSKDKCCSIKLRSNSSSIITPPVAESPMNYSGSHSHTKFKSSVEPVEEPKPAISSSTI